MNKVENSQAEAILLRSNKGRKVETGFCLLFSNSINKQTEILYMTQDGLVGFSIICV